MRQPLLELKEAGREFTTGEQSFAALKGINLSICAGEMVAVVGASGSGKSTLMNILGCLDRLSTGRYLINGRDTGTLDSNALAELRREHFGFIFQRYHLLPHLDALQNTEIPAVYSGMDKLKRRARSAALLTSLGLADRCHHLPGQLSGGQQQRVSIARSLMNGGAVILADEPTGALDSKSGQEMMKILHQLHDAGHTIILVTHDLSLADHAERIIEICDGIIFKDHANPKRPLNPPRPSLIREGANTEGTEHFSARPPLTRGDRGVAAWGRFAEAFTMALKAMTSHRLRTFLTMLGIIIGITSVVSIVALGEGTREKVINDISSMGTNVIDIYPGKDWGDEKSGSIQTLTREDLEALQAQVYVDSITPGIYTNLLIRSNNITVNASVGGVSEQYFRVRGVEMAQGSAFLPDHIRRQAQVVIIDENTRKKLFATSENPLGTVILLGSLPCQIVGVSKDKEGPFASNQNLNVWVPYTAAMSRLFGQHHFTSITVRVRDTMSNQIAEASIVKLLTRRHGTKDFYTNSSDTILKTVNSTTDTLTLLISSVAVISLIVGGIGVMNIMLVSVTERAHEIGIRMAVGARQSDILQQFLIEAVLVCLIGGSIGILLAFGLGKIFALFFTIITIKLSLMSLVVAFFCSSAIGVLFGFIPARNAARLDPVDALARE
ncbi:MAG TPA: MacB family efflux pump subunit [Desulfuromonadales bacterium]|nr:MacB family efflux pump subunit [Desulfuromonadales bacterium]